MPPLRQVDRRILLLPLLAVILAAMAIGVLAGLARIGWSVPAAARIAPASTDPSSSPASSARSSPWNELSPCAP